MDVLENASSQSCKHMMNSQNIIHCSRSNWPTIYKVINIRKHKQRSKCIHLLEGLRRRFYLQDTESDCAVSILIKGLERPWRQKKKKKRHHASSLIQPVCAQLHLRARKEHASRLPTQWVRPVYFRVEGGPIHTIRLNTSDLSSERGCSRSNCSKIENTGNCLNLPNKVATISQLINELI